MRTVKENPNDVQISQAKSTRPGSIEQSKSKENAELQRKKEKKVKGDRDEAVSDEKPFDARSNNMHQKR